MESQVLSVRRWGNSGGVLLPREWLGKQVEVVLVDRSNEIKEEVFEILKPYLEDVYGIYLVGSYARGEQDRNSDIDIVVISGRTRTRISSGRYNVEIYTLAGVRETLKKNPVMIYPRLKEARAILNKDLLKDLLKVKINYNNVRDFIEDCKRAVKINKGFIDFDREVGNNLDSSGVLYSLVLRLRGIYFIGLMFSGGGYSNRKFLKWLRDGTGLPAEEVDRIYEIYRKTKADAKAGDVFSVEVGEKLLGLLEREVEKYGKKKKAS